MGDYRQHEYSHRLRSSRTTMDEDADFQYALQLSAELNGDLGGHAEAAAAVKKRQAAYGNNFDMAVQMQFDNKTETKSNGHPSSYRSDANAPSLTVPGPNGANSSSATGMEPESSGGRRFSSFPDFADSESDVTELFQNWYKGKGSLSSLLQCKMCDALSCIGCTSTAFSTRSSAVSEDKSVSWCCSTGRLLLIWILLCGFDVSYCEVKAKGVKEAEASKKKPEPLPKTEGKGKGKAKADHSTQRSGIGYGGDDYSFSQPSNTDGHDPGSGLDEYSWVLNGLLKDKTPWRVTGPGRTISDQKSQAFEHQQAMDKLAATVFRLLQHLLPCLERGQPFDMDPPAMIVEMLLESRLLDYSLELLSNNSLDDVVVREATYDALLEFVQVIGLHYTTANQTVFSGKPKQPELCNLLSQTYCRVNPLSSGTASSIADTLHELSRLSSLLVKNAELHKTIPDAGNGREMLSLCRKISDVWASLSVHILVPDSEALPSTSSAEVAAIGDVPDKQICKPHSFSTQAQAQLRSAPGRFKRLLSEMSVLKTSLPPGIFVRHGESRLDVLKFVIIGPGGSPYEDGMWEFDMYCPAEYPNVPPLVSFKTTGGGRYGLNPNLYPDGKVCLSLLGTWPGEPWNPGQSTLLQVLVSLQAMVFCEQPWYNEPGRESSYGNGTTNKAAEQYNRRIRELTVRFGMLGWLHKSPEIWQDVMERHFKSNADKILGTVIEWSKESSPRQPGVHHGMLDLPGFQDHESGGYETGYKATLPELHRRLLKYGATVALPETGKQETEPRAKKTRMGVLEGERSLEPAPPGATASLASYFDFEDSDHLMGDDMDDMDDVDDVEAVFGSVAAFTGGSRGGGIHYGNHGFGGRGHVLGSGAGDPFPAPAPPVAPGGGRGGGHGRGGRGYYSWLAGVGRGRGAPAPFDPSASVQELKHGKGRRLGDDDK